MTSPAAMVKPMTSVEVLQRYIDTDGLNPNCSVHGNPLLIYKGALDVSQVADPPSLIERLLHSNGFPPQWRFGMYKDSHYHSTTHEILAVHRGSATLEFGGLIRGIEENLEAGDVIIVPAGLAHRLISEESGFEMVGAYPIGCEWDMCYGTSHQECNQKIGDIRKVKSLKRDPIWGRGGPVMTYWS